MSLPTEFSSLDKFTKAFDLGLHKLLDRHQGLGVFILVLANAIYDSRINKQLNPALKQRFEKLSAHYQQILINGTPITDPDDDLLVFLKLMAIGWNQLPSVQFRQLGDWELQYNALRAFRPGRMSHISVSGLSTPFSPTGFQFNKAFLQKEVFWSGELLGRKAALLYNKFPFAPLHGILVPEPQAEHPQFLLREIHEYIWQLTEHLANNIPGIAFGYNAYGAYASVNHLHFQSFVRAAKMPVEQIHWQHNGGDQDYPLPCLRFNDSNTAWQAIADLHQQGITYNLLYRANTLWCLPHRHQGNFELVEWATGMSWCELSGSQLTVNRLAFDTLTKTDIASAMAATALV